MNGRRLQFGIAVIDGCLFVVGGRDGLKTMNTVECFDPKKKQWTSMTPMGTHRHGLGQLLMLIILLMGICSSLKWILCSCATLSHLFCITLAFAALYVIILNYNSSLQYQNFPTCVYNAIMLIFTAICDMYFNSVKFSFAFV